MNNDFSSHRREYSKGALSEDSINACPYKQFEAWYGDASEVVRGEPNACALGTVSASGEPSVRFVLLKAMREEGFVFFSHYDSRKGGDLSQNDSAALTFYWAELERQVRLEGRVHQVSAAESDAYFASRPRNAQIGATVSKQSRTLSSRQELEESLASVIANLGDKEIVRPPQWGGYCLVPNRYEFWQGREDRLHDRIQYTRSNANEWKVERLWP